MINKYRHDEEKQTDEWTSNQIKEILMEYTFNPSEMKRYN